VCDASHLAHGVTERTPTGGGATQSGEVRGPIRIRWKVFSKTLTQIQSIFENPHSDTLESIFERTFLGSIIF